MPTLALVETMVHEIPRGRRTDGGEQLVLSSLPTPLNPQTDRFIREEMLSPLSTGREIVDAELGRSSVPRLAREVLLDNSRLPEHSRAIALHLHEAQTGAASAGVVMTSVAKEDGADRFVILKAEHQEGVRLRHTGEGETIVFQVEHLTELIMAQNSRVFKIAMFWVDPTTDKVFGRMVDKQNGAGYADYFLDEFLGCQLTQQAELQVQGFVKSLEKFLNSPGLSPEKKTRYATAVVAMLESPAPRIRPSQFIIDFVDPEDQDDLAHLLPDQVRGMEFRKDTTLVQAQIGGLRMKMSSGVTVSATPEALNNGIVRIEPESAEGPRVIVLGTTDELSLGKPPSR